MSCYFLDSTAFVKLFVQEAGTDAIIRLMEATEDNRKLISAGTPLEVYASLKRRERAGGISPEDSESARGILRMEAARQVLDRHQLRSAEALQLGAAVVAREMFQGMEIVFVSSDARLLEAAKSERFRVLNPIDEQN